MKKLTQKVTRAESDLGEFISSWRRLLGLTAAQVANRADIAPSTYSKIENGSLNVSTESFLSVCSSLGILDKLLDALDPYNSDLGRIRADQALPKRIRQKKTALS
ncbi:MAG: helix-turn-helix domain-containing protein [Coriobacteriales bacterium]|jgi:transcriptional regulator with XRE-family HTH domain|nr:helix-turn-helix domain-containing protein [Coriobacteriales bacterium]